MLLAELDWLSLLCLCLTWRVVVLLLGYGWWFAGCVLHGGCCSIFGCCLGFGGCCLAVAVVALLFLVGCWVWGLVVSVSVLFWLRACLYVLAVGFRWFRFVV